MPTTARSPVPKLFTLLGRERLKSDSRWSTDDSIEFPCIAISNLRKGGLLTVCAILCVPLEEISVDDLG